MNPTAIWVAVPTHVVDAPVVQVAIRNILYRRLGEFTAGAIPDHFVGAAHGCFVDLVRYSAVR
jgi:hypothetical protein